MKKNLFEADVKNEIIERCSRITEQSMRKWGHMEPAEMLHHCSEALNYTLSKQRNTKPSNTRQRVFKFLILHFISKFPEGAKAPRVIDMKKNNFIVNSLEREKDLFKETINRFYNYSTDINVCHPYFGNMNKKQWGIITWMHMDHHLRQFGV